MFLTVFIYLSVFLFSISNCNLICNNRYLITYSGKKIKENGVITFVFIFLPVIFLYAFRYNVGVDYQNYVDFFDYMVKTGEVQIFGNYMEPGYILLNVVVSFFVKNAYGVFLVCAIIFFGVFYIICQKKKNEIDIVLAYYILLMVYFAFFCNGIRQMLAAVIVLAAYQYLIEKNFKKYILFLLVASLFHASAIYCIVFYPVVYFKKKYIRYLKILMVGLMGIIILFPQVVTKLISYTGYSEYIDYQGGGNIRGMLFLLYVVPVLYIIERYKKELINKNYKYSYWIILMYVQLPIQAMGIINGTVERMSVYVAIIQVLLLPAIVKAIPENIKKRKVKKLCYMWYFLYFMVMSIFMNGNDVVPYQTIFGKTF